ncbi:MAG: hypothetical protein V3R30_07195 [Kiloniellales bacterium]|jgi:hypothetical protein
MAIDEKIKRRIEQLLVEASSLAQGDPDTEGCRNSDHFNACVGWLTTAQGIVELVCPPFHAYRRGFPQLLPGLIDMGANWRVGTASDQLRRLLADIEDGLLVSVADQATAETFDDFLDHADFYLRQNRKDPAGVIAGVVFEDSLRRICTANDITEVGQKLDDLISQLQKAGVLSAMKTKRARAAAGVRTKATHAQWPEFDGPDVEATIKFTRELLEKLLP